MKCWNNSVEDLLSRGLNNRSCIPMLHDCGKGGGISRKKQRCKEYLAPVSLPRHLGRTKGFNGSRAAKLFRNKDCLECAIGNHLKNLNFTCYSKMIPPTPYLNFTLIIEYRSTAHSYLNVGKLRI